MLNILKPYSNELTQNVQVSYIEDLMMRERARNQTYIRNREYYDGVHQTQLTKRLRAFLDLHPNIEFNANYCPIIVNAKADRLKLTGFETEDSKAEPSPNATTVNSPKPQSETLWQWWRKNRMDKTQGIVHRAAIRDADAFVLVEWDKLANLPRFHYEKAGTENGVMVYYSEERSSEIAFASKHWCIDYGVRTGKTRRLNLYFPDRIEKYISDNDVAFGAWQAFTQDENSIVGKGMLGQAGILWWTDSGTADGLPLGIPIVHFKENDNGDGYGTSHLNNVIPIQDATNKSLIDLLGAMDVEGFGLLVGLGEDWGGVQVGVGSIAYTTKDKNVADLKRIEGSDPTRLVMAYNALVMEMFRISGTPLSYAQISGQTPAEGTMKQQETSLIAQVEKAQTDFGNAWEDCMIIARRLHNAFSEDAPLDEDLIIDTQWKQAELRNDKEQAETLAIRVRDLGVSEDQAQIEMGYDDEDRQKFKNEAARKQAMMLRQQNANNQASRQNMNQTENGIDDATPRVTNNTS